MESQNPNYVQTPLIYKILRFVNVFFFPPVQYMSTRLWYLVVKYLTHMYCVCKRGF